MTKRNDITSYSTKCDLCGHHYRRQVAAGALISHAHEDCPECAPIRAKVGADVFEWLKRVVAFKIEAHEDSYRHDGSRSACGCC